VITHNAGALLPHRFTLTCTRSPEPSAVFSLWHCPHVTGLTFREHLPCGAPTSSPPVARRCGHPVDSPSVTILTHAHDSDKSRIYLVTPRYPRVVDEEVSDTEESWRSAPSTNCSPRDFESAYGRRHPHWSRRDRQGLREGSRLRRPRGRRFRVLRHQASVLNAHCWATPWAP